MKGAYYNEYDKKAAAWLRELIRRNLIAPGDVDERSIEDIVPGELDGYAQCHFFAGIGVWSYALRQAGWSDDRPIWTGSCPCQPFSQAGASAGFADERHLWPAWHHLIRVRRPPVVVGEQVASPAAALWTDLVQDDLEGLGYAFGAVAFPAASVGAPHIRDRQYWLAHHHHARRIEHAQCYGEQVPRREESALGDNAGGRGKLGDTSGAGSGRNAGAVLGAQSRAERCLRGELDFTQPSGGNGSVADTDGRHAGTERLQRSGQHGQQQEDSGVSELGHHHTRLEGRSLPASGRAGKCSPWTPSDFVWCRDGKWRPVESGTFPLAHGAPARVGRLRGYGNAIVAEAAKVFIEESGLL